MKKKAKIKKLVNEMLNDSVKAIKSRLIDKALNSGAIDIEGWSEDHSPMILPKSIVIDLLNHEADQYSARGTSFEKQVKKNVKNIGLFL